MNLYKAKVIKNNHSDQDGSVQIYIESLHRDIKPDLYPWAMPAKEGAGGSSSFGISCIPEINSLVWVFFEKEQFHRNAFYIWDLNLKDLNPHKLYTNNVKSTVGSEAVYPDVKYIYLKSGICIAASSSVASPEITIYHPKAYAFIDKNGYLYFKDTYDNRFKSDNTGIRLKDTKNNEIRSDGTKLVINNNFTVEQ